MNPVIETIKRRRSVRSYEATPVPRDMVEAIIDAGNWAPTTNNHQRWRFVVVEDDEFKQRLTNAALPKWKEVLGHLGDREDAHLYEYFIEFGPRCLGWRRQSYQDTVRQLRDIKDGIYWGAPAAIFVIGAGSHPQECAMVCENMMIAAQSLGLGSCIAGFGAFVTDDDEAREVLELKEGEAIYGPIVVGYPRISPEAPRKKEPVVKWV
jgi:nitroreductase